MPQKDKDLEPVKDLKMVQRYLRYGLEFHEPVSCYLEAAELRFDAYLKFVDVDKMIVELDLNEDGFKKMTALQLAHLDTPKAEVRLSYSVNEATFFVHTKINGRMQRRLMLRAEMPMYKLQRRESLRIKVMEAHKAKVKLGGTQIEFALFDISAGGISVLVSLEQQKDYQKQQLFPGSTLSFTGKEFKVDLEVMGILSSSKDGLKWKIGLRFKALPASVEQMIAREAYLHTAKIWSRWL